MALLVSSFPPRGDPFHIDCRLSVTDPGSGLSAAFLAEPQQALSVRRLRNGHVRSADQRAGSAEPARAARLDVVVIDSPPIPVLPDTTLWLAMASGVILVAREDKTRRGPLSAAAEAVKASNVPILGVVLNASDPKRRRSYYYHAGYNTAVAPRTSEPRDGVSLLYREISNTFLQDPCVT